MNVFTHPDFDQHEQVIFCNDPSVGLQAIIALHSTVLGPAAGGCRMHPYPSEHEALTDVLRLSKGMSYKNVMAGLPLGGGKSVIIADPTCANKAELLRAFSTHIQNIGGRYWTAIDIGVGPEDADIMAQNCDYIFARASQYEQGFNPSLFTALGGYIGIQAVAKHVWDRDHLSGLRVAIQGLGATGSALANHLHKAGVKLVVADVREDAVQAVVDRHSAQAVDPNDILWQQVDVVAPCAMGGIINDMTIPQIKAKAICGLANNQLAQARHGIALQAKGIAYVPDYVVNAGGMMGASTVIFDTSSREESIKRIHGLFDTITNILARADETGQPASEIADHMAMQKISQAKD